MEYSGRITAPRLDLLADWADHSCWRINISLAGLRRRKIPSQVIRKAFLVEVEGHQPGAEWELDKDEITLGRLAAENDIYLKGKKSLA